jgi:hypothetical protein
MTPWQIETLKKEGYLTSLAFLSSLNPQTLNVSGDHLVSIR